ncbi:T9SS type A sorting domain-containing protein [Aureisphaera galaxeae]|uniref:virginiamycin B lyase family protein n=1 Tax=Aureisphaera galaxeae TaxID=1538023 RepID=UPI002350A2FB|nr:T9SS type A sorting domain-containing protein [Aureisphaera galaxeae]MDC8004010.1 T9SS type A sorting domain-containing protein [Aureisphaera galaxeae]
MKKENLLLITLTMLISLTSISQTVTTVSEESPDDGIALDSNGNVYLSEFSAGRILKYDTAGEMTVFIEGLTSCNGIAFDSNDNLFVCDYFGQAIVKFDSDGNQLASYPVTGNASGIIKDFDSDDMIFCTYDENSIYRLAIDGTITEIASGGDLNGPVGLAMGDDGSLYAGNLNDAKIYRVSSSGALEFIAQIVPGDGGSFLGFITYAQGSLWGTMLDSHEIYSINPNGIDDITHFAGSAEGSMDGDISVATFSFPSGILFNSAGDRMYITDSGTQNLRIISGIPLSTKDYDLAKNDFFVSPNPTSTILNVRLPSTLNGAYSVRIMDSLGKVVFYHKNITGSTNVDSRMELDISSFNNGLYFIEAYNGRSTFTKKLIKL